MHPVSLYLIYPLSSFSNNILPFKKKLSKWAMISKMCSSSPTQHAGSNRSWLCRYATRKKPRTRERVDLLVGSEHLRFITYSRIRVSIFLGPQNVQNVRILFGPHFGLNRSVQVSTTHLNNQQSKLLILEQ